MRMMRTAQTIKAEWSVWLLQNLKIRNRVICIVAVIMALLALAVAPARAQVYDFAADFSATSNPNGVWSYGWSTTRGSAFNLMAFEYSVVPGLHGWTPSSGVPIPAVARNMSNAVVTPACCNPIASGTINSTNLHPGPSGENAIVRWTAPAAGMYRVSASFIGDDTAGTTTDVAVLHNTNQLYASEVTGFGILSAQSFSSAVIVAAGDTIDFSVGFGTDLDYGSDGTTLNATITPLGLTIYDVADDFSATSNPNGVWSYGWSTTRGSAFNLMTDEYSAVPGLDSWAPSSSVPQPTVTKNVSYVSVNPFPLPLLTVSLHPGPRGENAIVRWTAPSAGMYRVSAGFIGDRFETTSDVAVLQNSNQLYASEVTGFDIPTTQSFLGYVTVVAGDTIEFSVGFGTDFGWLGDDTILIAAISKVSGPDTVPPTVAFLGTINGPPKQVQISSRDIMSGLQSIQVPTCTNCTASSAVFTPGMTNAVITTATKTDATKSSSVKVIATDMAGNSAVFDPVDMTIQGDGKPEVHTLSISSLEHVVQITNGEPGIHHMILKVNQVEIPVSPLKNGESRSFDIGYALSAGKANLITITGFGGRHATAWIVFTEP